MISILEWVSTRKFRDRIARQVNRFQLHISLQIAYVHDLIVAQVQWCQLAQLFQSIDTGQATRLHVNQVEFC